MTLLDAQLYIKDLQNKCRKNKIYNYIKCHNKEVFQFIENYYTWPENTTSYAKIFWILNGLTEIPKCIVCGKQLDINQFSKRTGEYVLHCSHYCGCHSNHAREQYKKTCLKKYGAEHNMKSQKGLEEYSASINRKYGVDYTFKSKHIRQKIQQTVQKKYDVDVISKAECVKEKISFANKSKTDEQKKLIVQKIKKTKLEKYNDENYVNVNKAKQTVLSKYGVTSYLATKQCKNNSIKALKTRAYNRLLENERDRPCFTLEEFLAINSDIEYIQFECLKCHKKFLSRHHDGYHDSCQFCYPKEEQHEERQFAKFILQLNQSTIENTRTVIPPKELDVFVSDKNIAFEFDGIYWHSDDVCKESINYHLNKTLACEEKGIQLIHVFENEWNTKQNIVKARIKNLLGVYDMTVYARKCEIREVSSKESRAFQEENHLQGAVNAKVSLGLFYKDELVSLMTFGKCRFDKKHEWEMLRFCSKLGYHVVGGAGKLLKHFERNWKPKSLVSYADRRWSQGKLYKALGFKLDHASSPNYWYWKNINQLESRIKYQKFKLKNILDVFDESKTEVENMKANGYHRIFDCGNLVFVKKF